jgi:predicted metal-dependent hydrolase
VQLRLPLAGRPGPHPRAPHRVLAAGRHFDLDVVRHHRARRYVLRLAGDRLRLTVPRGASIAGGVRFAERQTDWIDREWRRQAGRAAPWTASTLVWWRGTEMAARDVAPSVGLALPLEEGADLRPAIEMALRAVAAAELPPRCLALAATHGLEVARVSVRNQRSRWGACSARGVITLNWRLVQMPPSVSDYVVLHELMHLRHANHARRFWREVEKVCADWREAERWLRRHGREVL